ncbi:MAG: branched-chain amino acid ABC transporter permease [Syntrophothermus sp.]
MTGWTNQLNEVRSPGQARAGGWTKTALTLVMLALWAVFLAWAQANLDDYKLRILNLSAINIILGVSLNLIYGFTGMFSLGHAGFMAVGAYVAALLTMPVAQKEMMFLMTPLIWPFNSVQWPFLPALLIAGLVSALFGLLIGLPVLRLRGDYLGIATLGFAEIIRVVANNLQSITNGALGLKGIPAYANLWWTWGWAIFTVFVIRRLVTSSYGRALMAIRENEIAAETMGVRLAYHKVLSFVTGAFFAGIGGGLLGSLVTTIDPKTFNFLLTFNIMLIIVVGGLGSITGTMVASVLYTVLLEVLRPIEAPIALGPIHIPGIPGMRMVVFSLLLMFVIIFYQQGLFGRREFSWDWLFGRFGRGRFRQEGRAR